MANNSKICIDFPKTTDGGVVILRRQDYDRIREKMKLLEKELQRQKEIDDVKKIIEEGERDYKAGRLKPMKSLAELD